MSSLASWWCTGMAKGPCLRLKCVFGSDECGVVIRAVFSDGAHFSGRCTDVRAFIDYATARPPGEWLKLGWQDQAAGFLRCSMTFSFFICP